MTKCKLCGYDRFLLYSSQNEKSCGKCGNITEWKRKEGQEPLVGNNRQGGKGLRK